MSWRPVTHPLRELRTLRTLRTERTAPTPHAARARLAADRAADVLRPLLCVVRGLRRQSVWLRSWWIRGPKERRGPVLALTAVLLLAVSLVPYGPALAVLALAAAAAWTGRDPSGDDTGPGEAAEARLQCLYEALTPWFSNADDPAARYTHGGRWGSAFTDFAFDGDGRLSRLHLRYPAWFTDQDPAARTRVEDALRAKAGRGREYRFTWDEEDNHLLLTALAPLPTDIAAQRFVTAPGESVLGFTDTVSTRRTTPVTTTGGTVRQAPPVIWRTGPRTTEPHLLALGHPGSGTTTLLRSLALQALHHGDLLLIDGQGSGEYAFLTGRPGVLAVETGLTGALTALEWAAHETERRLSAVNRARRTGHPAPPDARRPLWIVLDRPTALARLAAAEGRTDPQALLDTPLRHGRAAAVTVAAADTLDAAADLSPALAAHCRARVALGQLTAEQAHGVLGAPPATTPAPDTPPGRGYARVGRGPVRRLQVPYTPDPYDDEAGDDLRSAVLGLLPPRHAPAASGAAAAVGVPAPAGQPTAGQAASGQPTAGRPPAGPPAGQPTAGQATNTSPPPASTSTAPPD